MKMNFGTSLSRSEMKNVFGGKQSTYVCVCEGSDNGIGCTGTSSYCGQKIVTYCGGSGATCVFVGS